MALHSKLWDKIAHEETHNTKDSIMEEMRELKEVVISKRGNQQVVTKAKKGEKTYGHL